jgi:hypothetical protein
LCLAIATVAEGWQLHMLAIRYHHNMPYFCLVHNPAEVSFVLVGVLLQVRPTTQSHAAVADAQR